MSIHRLLYCNLIPHLDALLQQGVESVHAAADAEVDRAIAKIDDETALDARVDLVRELDALSLCSVLRRLERALQTLLSRLVQCGCAGHNHFHLTAMGAHELQEAVNNALCLTQSAVFSHSLEEVSRLYDSLISTVSPSERSVKVSSPCDLSLLSTEKLCNALALVLRRQGRVGDEVLDLACFGRSAREKGFDLLQVGLNLVQRFGIFGSGSHECTRGVLSSKTVKGDGRLDGRLCSVSTGSLMRVGVGLSAHSEVRIDAA